MEAGQPEVDPKDLAQKRLNFSGIKPDDVYQHYKGGIYVVVALAIEEATLVPVVVYRSYLRDTIWTRPLSVFTEYVATGNPRFRYMGCCQG